MDNTLRETSPLASEGQRRDQRCDGHHHAEEQR
jgi:hypothetical protein